MILSLATIIARIGGCLFSRTPARSRREVTRPVAGRPSMFRITFRCVSTPEIFGRTIFGKS